MRTTLNIEEDVLLAAKEIARQRGVSVGRVVSDLLRRALLRGDGGETRQGVPLFPVRDEGSVVTLEMVNRLRDDAP